MADCLVADGAFDHLGVIRHCSTVIQAGEAPASAKSEAALMLGAARLEIGAPGAAMADLDHAIQLAPEQPAPFALRGALKLAIGDADGAVRDFDVAIRLDPGHAPLRDARAAARFAASDMAGALEDWREAHRLDPARFPADPRARLAVARGAEALSAGDAALSLDAAREALGRAPGDAAALALEGAALAATGARAQATESFLRAIEADPAIGRSIEQALGARGYEPGAIDGRPGPGTRAALDACIAADCRLLEDPRFRFY